MKAIQINFEGNITPKFSTIAEEDKFGFCTISKRAFDYISAQSLDGKIYTATGMEECDACFCGRDGKISRYSIKSQVYDMEHPLMLPKDGEWEWKTVELRVVNIMD